MRRIPFSRRRGLLLACALVVTPAGAFAAQVAQAASPMQACLDGRFDKWVKARVDLVLNEDPKAGDVDDAAVARWTSANLTACQAQAGGGEPDVEEQFAKRMSHWREHIYNAVQRMRELVKPD